METVIDVPGVGPVHVHATTNADVEAFLGEEIDFGRGMPEQEIVEVLPDLPRHDAVGEWCSAIPQMIDNDGNLGPLLTVFSRDEYEIQTYVDEEMRRRFPGAYR